MGKKQQLSRNAALAVLAGMTGLAIAQTAHADPTTAWVGGAETREEDRRFHVSGRFMYDMAYTDADFASPAGAAFDDGVRSYARRAFIGVDGRLTTHWRYNAKFDITFGSNGTAPNGQATLKADDFYLEYADDWGSVFIGNGNWVSPLEDRDSSLNIPFNERSFLISAGGFGKKPGVGFLTNGGNWSLGAALQSSDGVEIGDTASQGGEPFFFIGRGTYAPVFEQTPEGTMLLGFGLTYRYRDRSSHFNSALSYSPNALSNKAGNTMSGAVGAAKNDTYLGAELVAQYNAFGAEAEYGQIDASRVAGSSVQLGDATATGYYVDLFWSLTGESRRYNATDGSFGAVTPLRTLGSDGGIGHVMASFRYEDFDLTDNGFANSSLAADRRNDTKAWTAGLTWAPIGHVKLQLNYSDTTVDYVVNDLNHRDNEIRAATFRTQFDW